jgi:hypothetical protein
MILLLKGYSFKCFNCYNEIYFKDLNQNENRKTSTNINKKQFSIQNSYQIQMIPNLPLIEDIKFIEKSFNSKGETFTTLLSNFSDKNVILTSKLGIK